MEYKLEIRKTEESDYKELCLWWKSWRWTPIPQEILPDNGNNGIMVSYDGINVCAGFIYATSSPALFHFEWMVSNRDVKNREVRKLAKKLLIEKACSVIKDAGGKVVYTSLKRESLVKDYEDCGWQKGSTGCLEMIKNLY